MKKRIFPLLILATALCGAARAQAQQPIKAQEPPRAQAPESTQPLQRWSLDFLAGPAYPVGQFARTERQNPQSGSVHTGSILELSGTYHLNRHWGIALLGGSQRHNSDVDEVAIPMSGPASPGPEYLALIAPQHWRMTRVLAGGAYTIPLNRKQNLALLARALAGIQQTKTSEYTYVMNYPGFGTSTSSLGVTLPWAFSYQADAGFQWRLYRWLSFLVYGGYNGCRPSYNQHFADEGILINGIAIPTANGATIKFHFPTGSFLLRGGVQVSL